MQIWGACSLAVVLNIAMVTDMLTGKIRNSMILTGLALGLLYQFSTCGMIGAAIFAGGVFLPFALTFPLFAFQAIGAGDVKLLMVTGGFLGITEMPRCLFYSLLISSGMAFLKMLMQGSFRSRFAYLAEYVREIIRERRMKPYGQSLQEEQAVIHLSVPILFAVFLCMIGGAI